MMRRSWTLGLRYLIPALHALIRFYHQREVALFADHWKASRPDLVVSVVSHFNRALCEGVARGAPGVPFVTVLTDLADYPPHMWLERQQQYVICGTDRAAVQAQEAGIPPRMIFRSSGMIVHPRFYEPLLIDRAEERRKLGLDENLPTGLVLFGGQGSRSMLEIAKRVDEASLAAQWIFICGHNQKLTDQLQRFQSRYKKLVLGFTTEVPYFMRLADFFIGKPGPGSISEALVMGLPVIVEDNAWTMPHERYNARWIQEQGVGVPVKKIGQVAAAVSEVLEPARCARFKSRISAMHNRAVFEAPRFFSAILETATQFSPIRSFLCKGSLSRSTGRH
jgi:1,2-diacylglycerol 3-beta-galactosyltransferase